MKNLPFIVGIFLLAFVLMNTNCKHKSENITSARLMNIEKNYEWRDTRFDIFIKTKKDIRVSILVWGENQYGSPESRRIWTTSPGTQGLLSPRGQLNTSRIKYTEPLLLKKGENKFEAALAHLGICEFRLIIVENDNIVIDKSYSFINDHLYPNR